MHRAWGMTLHILERNGKMILSDDYTIQPVCDSMVNVS